MGRLVFRVFLGFFALIAFAVIGGAMYEAFGRKNAVISFPPAGRMVDVGDRRIQLDCRGAGNPTVVFESGLDIYGSLSWSAVHGDVAKTTRACAYSRAGIMWSDPRDDAHDGKAVAEDLHAALNRAGERGPFVLVGHSIGGPYITIYTRYFGTEVAGLVFVDASHPEQEQRLSIAGATAASKLMLLRDKVGAALHWTGLVRAVVGASRLPLSNLHDEDAVKAYASTSLGGISKETDAREKTLSEAGTFREFGARPLVVLTAMAPWPEQVRAGLGISAAQAEQWQDAWKRMHDEQATWSSQGQHLLVPDAGHYVQLDRPDIVIKAIQMVVNKVRGNRE